MEMYVRFLCAAFAVVAPPVLTTEQGELFKLLPDDGGLSDIFGWSVGVSGTTAVVGAPWDDEAGGSAGAAYLFDTTTGDQLLKLLASDSAEGDWLGEAVAIEGDRILAGAPQQGALNLGAAYVFDAAGNELFKLVADDAASGDYMGDSVGLSGTLAIVGAPRDDDLGGMSGSAYLFDATTGAQLHKLLPDDGAVIDRFGSSVAVGRTLAIVGAPYDDDQGEDSGAAYVFDATTGAQLFKLLPDDGAAEDVFGYSVAISGTTAVIGAHRKDDNGDLSGAAYLFDTTTGQQIAKLLPADNAAGDAFGFSVAIDGSTAAVSAPEHAFFGAVYLFDVDTRQEIGKYVATDSANDDVFGFAVGISGTTTVAGSYGDDDLGNYSGSAYVFYACQDGGASFCDASDGALATCPCANPGAPDTGCDNAQGTGGVRACVMAQDTDARRATLVGIGYPPASTPTAIVIRGNTLEASPQVFFDGVRCVGLTGLVRLATAVATGGTSAHVFTHDAGAGTYYYQIWYRNTPITFCDATAGANASNGQALTW